MLDAPGPEAVAAAVPGPMPEDTLTAAPGAIPLTVAPVEVDVIPELTPDPGGPETECPDDADGAEEVWPAGEPWPAPVGA